MSEPEVPIIQPQPTSQPIPTPSIIHVPTTTTRAFGAKQLKAESLVRKSFGACIVRRSEHAIITIAGSILIQGIHRFCRTRRVASQDAETKAWTGRSRRWHQYRQCVGLWPWFSHIKQNVQTRSISSNNVSEAIETSKKAKYHLLSEEHANQRLC